MAERRGEWKRRLREALEKDLRASAIPLAAGGRIERTHYANLIDVSFRLIVTAATIFKEFEARLGSPASIYDLKLPAIRAHLEEGLAKGSLRIKGGKVVRGPILASFAIRRRSNDRKGSARVLALFDEFDRRVAEEGYRPTDLAQAVKRLQHILLHSCPLGPDKLSVNQTELSRLSGIAYDRLRSPPFLAMVETATARIKTAAAANPLTPMVGGRAYDLSPLAAAWPLPFVTRIGGAIRDARSSPAHLAAMVRSIKAFLGSIAESDNASCRAVMLEAATGTISPMSLDSALRCFRASVESDPAAKKKLSDLSAALRLLAAARVLPRIRMSARLAAPKRAARKGGAIKSLAEVPRPQHDEPKGGQDLFGIAQSLLAAAYRKRNLKAEPDARGFLETIAAEPDVDGVTPETFPAAVLAILQRRLGAIRAKAEAMFEDGMARLQEGAAMLGRATVDPVGFLAAYASAGHNPAKQRLLNRWFPKNDGEVSSANILRLMAARDSANARTIELVIHSLRRSRRGWRWPSHDLAAFLEPQMDTLGAVLVLYLCDSGANVEVGRTLKADCLSRGLERRHTSILGSKARAKGRAIIRELPDRSATVRALQWVATEAAGVRAKAAPGERDLLFVARFQGRARAMSHVLFRRFLERFTADIPELGGARVLPRMIRPSFILRTSLESDGVVALGMAAGDHGEGIAQGYQQRHAVRALYDQHLLRFATRLETLITANVPAAHLHLGLTPEELERRREDLRPTGLGTYCSWKRTSTGAEPAGCASLGCWNDCPHMVVIADLRSIASMQIWQAALRRSQPDWERDRPNRWARHYLPWLCLIDVVESKMTRGRLAQIWHEAKAVRAAIEADPTFFPPHPF